MDKVPNLLPCDRKYRRWNIKKLKIYSARQYSPQFSMKDEKKSNILRCGLNIYLLFSLWCKLTPSRRIVNKKKNQFPGIQIACFFFAPLALFWNTHLLPRKLRLLFVLYVKILIESNHCLIMFRFCNFLVIFLSSTFYTSSPCTHPLTIPSRIKEYFLDTIQEYRFSAAEDGETKIFKLENCV